MNTQPPNAWNIVTLRVRAGDTPETLRLRRDHPCCRWSALTDKFPPLPS